jgi:hypothetical protein
MEQNKNKKFTEDGGEDNRLTTGSHEIVFKLSVLFGRWGFVFLF